MSFVNVGTPEEVLINVSIPAGQGLRWRGAWAANTDYAPYDLLTSGGSSYFAPAAFTSGTSFDTSHLSLFAAAGTPGEDGTSGTQTYANETAGNAGTSAGQFFQVPITSPDGGLSIYENGQTAPVTQLGGLTVVSGGDRPWFLKDPVGGIVDFLDATDVAALLAPVNAAQAALNTASQNVPVAGSSLWAQTTSPAQYNVVQGFLPFVISQDCTDLQVVFSGWFGGEAYAVPGTIRVAMQDSAGIFHTCYFGGRRNGIFAPPASLLTDPIALDFSKGDVVYFHYQFRRAAGNTSAIQAGWTFGSLNPTISGANPLGPGITNTRSGGNYFEAVELLIERTVTDATFSGTTMTSASAAFTPFETNQTVTLSDGSKRLYTYASPTTATLSSAPAGGVTATVALTATDKTRGAADYRYADPTGGVWVRLQQQWL